MEFLNFLTILLVAAPVLVQSQGMLNFDCRRAGYPALCTANGATCDTSNGECTCASAAVPPEFNNYVCQTFTPDTTACTSPCQNGGICVTGGTCECTYSFYGADCAIPRAQVYCNANQMFVNIFPHTTPFTGEIAVYQYSEVEACKLTAAAGKTYATYILDSQNLEGVNIELDHVTTNCGNATVSTAADGVSQVYTRHFIVRYNPNMMSSVDQVITGNCTTVEGSNDITGTIPDIAGVDVNIDGLDQVSVDGQVETVTMAVLNAGGQPLQAQVTIGDPIQLSFSLAQGNVFTDFKVTSCTANNTLDPTATLRQFNFIQNDCPNPDNLAMFNGGITKTTPAAEDTTSPITVSIPIKVFKFWGASSMVAFSCSVTLCKAGSEADCVSTSCTATSSSSGSSGTSNSNSNSNASNATSGARRKREASDQENLSVLMTVRDPFSKDEVLEQIKQEVEEKDCMDNSGVVALVVMLSVAVGLLLVLSTLLIIRLFSARGGKGESSHTNSGLNFNAPRPAHQGPSVENLHIPRLEFNHHGNQGC